MDTRRGGSRYCPSCKKIVETRVLLEGYSQEEIHGIPAKKRQIICGTDAEGSNGCGTRWFMLEILEDQVTEKAVEEKTENKKNGLMKLVLWNEYRAGLDYGVSKLNPASRIYLFFLIIRSI